MVSHDISSARKALLLDGVRAAYGKKEILHGVTFRILPGEVLGLLGGNGSGKTTILKVIAGLLCPKEGTVWLGEENITGLRPHEIQRRHIGYLPQGGRAFASLTVRENLALSSCAKGSNSDHTGGCEDSWFARLGNLKNRRAGLLSGGERQMLAIEMIVRQRPAVLLLDEPTAGLAPALAADALDRIAHLAKENRSAILLVEQNVAEARRVAHRCLVLAEGRVTAR
jgi:ABC-type branched-subunit amino acid transport system ATPase component